MCACQTQRHAFLENRKKEKLAKKAAKDTKLARVQELKKKALVEKQKREQDAPRPGKPQRP